MFYNKILNVITIFIQKLKSVSTKLDWNNRFRNKYFLTALLSAFILLSQQFGIKLPSNISDIINTVLVILTLLGVVVDPSTPGFADKAINEQIDTNNQEETK